MARYILCPKCHEKMQAVAKQHGEFYEALEGKAARFFLCDGGRCGNTIEAIKIYTGDRCFAVCCLPFLEERLEKQRPKYWADAELMDIQF